MKTKRIIKNLIENSNLSYGEKKEAEHLLERAYMSEENQNLREIISTLTQLYDDLEKKMNDDYLAPRYMDLIQTIISDYKLRVRRKDNLLDTNYFQPFDDYTPISFRDLLNSLGEVKDTENGKMVFYPKDPEILNGKVKIAEDDGQGYAPKGFNEVFSGYIGEDGNIYLWV